MNRKELKIISLNTWGGQVDGILDFFRSNQDVDIFCLQEVHNVNEEYIKNGKFEEQNKIDKETWGDEDFILFKKIKDIFINHDGYFKATYKNHFGLSIFIKKDIYLLKEDSIVVLEKSNSNDKKDFLSVQYCSFEINNQIINICNFHGLSTGKGKDDSEERIKQSQNIINFLKTLEGEIILCGDFNLLPDTESIKMIEDFGFKNLIKENNITSTRTSYYTKPLRFADYTFVSKDVEVKSFEIMKEEVSDHAAMKIVISI